MQVPLAIYIYLPRYDLSHKSSKLSFSTLQKSSCVLVAGPICFVLNHLMAISMSRTKLATPKNNSHWPFHLPSILTAENPLFGWLFVWVNPPSLPSKIGTITPRFALRNLRLSQDTQDTWDEHILGLRYFVRNPTDTSLLFNLLLGL